ncbi:PHB depolymerase family esterase [Nocardia sp. NPDC005998]|uniref:extracellular catalytic domain type 1 short-chain-length polyhydroxyalkanoate depolymerase n=1 Tax=Nocardia sp. NPDC005998 TaxID=3156894 RepID=UPI0033AD8EB8
MPRPRVLTTVMVCLMSCAMAGLGLHHISRAETGPDGDQLGQLSFGGLVRTYGLHIPAGTDHPAGLVVNLHGGGSTGHGQESLTHYDTVADRHGFIVVYPDGIEHNWADGRGASEPDRRGIDDVGFLVALVDKLARDFDIDRGHVFATGMSNGGFMADRLACDRADVFAAIAPVAGTLGANVNCAPTRPVSVLETHGTADPIVPFTGGTMTGRGGQSTILPALTTAARWREADRCQAPTEELLPAIGNDATQVHRLTATACADGTEVTFMQVDNGGHTWPGGLQYLPKAIIGPTTDIFDASEASWQFFAAHAR